MSTTIGEFSVQTHFPEELLLQILLRLPVKSLIRFKSVSKAWLALIDSPFFVDHHLDFINKNAIIKDHHHLLHLSNCDNVPSVAGKALLIGPSGVVMDIEGAPFLDRDDQLGLHGRQFSETFDQSLDKLFLSSIWGPINGVYCVKIHAQVSGGCTFLLWNPGIRQVHILPPIPPVIFPSSFAEILKQNKYEFEEQYLLCGYGYDPLSNDYKVILTTMYGDEYDELYHHYSFHLYSLATNSWKELDPFEIIADKSIMQVYAYGGIAFVTKITSSLFHAWDNGVYSNGSCHWFLRSYSEYDYNLLSFDFGDVAFQVTSIPLAIIEVKSFSPTLTTMDGSLALVFLLDYEHTTQTSNAFDVCVMRDNGVEKLWVRAYRIVLPSSCPGSFIGIVGDEFFVREEHDGNGKVASYCLGSLEPENGRCEYCSLDVPRVRILPYEESLISLKHDGISYRSWKDMALSL